MVTFTSQYKNTKPAAKLIAQNENMEPNNRQLAHNQQKKQETKSNRNENADISQVLQRSSSSSPKCRSSDSQS